MVKVAAGSDATASKRGTASLWVLPGAMITKQ
jgi:hypothetical protein